MPIFGRPEPVAIAGKLLRAEDETLNKHQLKTEETRRKLLKSARKIFAQSGFEAARLEDIAQDAGHTRGAFYAHFARKEDLFFALLENEIRQQLQSVQSLFQAKLTTSEKLRALRDSYVARLNDPTWSMLVLEFKMFAVRRPKLRARLAANHRAMRAAIRMEGLAEFLAQCPACAFSSEATKVILESFLQSLLLQRAYDPNTLSSSDASEALGKVFDTLLGC